MVINLINQSLKRDNEEVSGEGEQTKQRDLWNTRRRKVPYGAAGLLTLPSRLRHFMISAILIFLLCSAGEIPAQENRPSWEERHGNNPHVILLSETAIEANTDGTYEESHHSILKVQKESAKDLGEVTISYDASYQKVTNVICTVTTPDGRTLNYSKMQELSACSEYSMYSVSKTIVFTLPEVNPGATIEKRYTIVNQKSRIAGHFFDSFYLALSAPVKTFRYEVSLPESMQATVHTFNDANKPSLEKKNGKVCYHWEQKDMDERKSEEFAPASNAIYPWVVITTIKDWKTISDWCGGLVEKNIILNDEIRRKVGELTEKKDKEKGKAEAILHYIRADYRYVSMSFGDHLYEPHPAKETYLNKYGDCKDQATLALTMLRGAGIKAWPALYCQEYPLQVYQEAPTLDYFNHMIVVIEADGNLFYADPTVDGYRLDEIPVSEQGAHLFVINEKGGYHTAIPVQDNGLGNARTEETYNISANGSAEFEGKDVFDRRKSIKYATMMDGMTDDIRKELFRKWEGKGRRILGLSYSDTKDKYSPFSLSMKAEISHKAKIQGKILLLEPDIQVPVFDFVTSERHFPVVSRSHSSVRYKTTYVLPENYEVEEVPEDLKIATKLFNLEVSYKVRGRTITGEYIMSYKKGRIELSEYAEFKSQCDILRDYSGKMIIARKAR